MGSDLGRGTVGRKKAYQTLLRKQSPRRGRPGRKIVRNGALREKVTRKPGVPGERLGGLEPSPRNLEYLRTAQPAPAKDTPLASGESAMDTGVHSKASWSERSKVVKSLDCPAFPGGFRAFAPQQAGGYACSRTK